MAHFYTLGCIVLFGWKFKYHDQAVSYTLHSRKIGDDKIYTRQTVDKDGKLTDDKSEEIDSFKTEWESGWNPKIAGKT